MKKALYCALVVALGFLTSQTFAQDTQERERPQTGERGKQGGARGQRGGQRGQRGGQRNGQAQAAKSTPVALKDGVAALTPENTKVSFVGTHTGDDPKPRLGGFKKFTGKLTPTEDGNSIKSLMMEFETNSLYTGMGGSLTSHLMNKDFLDVEKYPSAKFVSTEVKAGEKEGMLNVVGDFTLMGKTNSITIPVKMTKSDAGVLVKGDFKLDRTSFGMNYGMEKISKEVSITLSVGEKTGEAAAGGGAGQGQGRGGRGGGGRGGFDPTAFFKERDTNGDGKLSGDEIPQQMQGRLDRLDANGDKAISLKEIQDAMQGGGQRGGGQRGGGGKGKGGGGR